MADSLCSGEYLDHMMVSINKLHYSYLCTHESLRKLEEKNRLEGHIKEYLMVAPHDKKFCYRETSHILHQSAETKENFSGYRASAAWTAIAAYAHNLLAQSWRKEFREIKVYSGYYVHNIESGLAGSEHMLTQMGYRLTGNGGTYVLDGPVDPDRVANVSRDSLVALVECQILCSLKADLIKSGCDCSWIEILEYRELHSCSLDQALRDLMYQYNQRCFNPCMTDCYSKTHCILDKQSFTLPQYRYLNDVDLPFYGNVSNGMQLTSPSCSTANTTSKCHTCQNDFAVNSPLRPCNNCTVPTAQLIELDSSYLIKEDHLCSTDNQTINSDCKNFNTGLNDNNSNFLKNKESWWENLEGASYQAPENKIKNHKYECTVDKRHKANEQFIETEELEEALKGFNLDGPHASSSLINSKITDKFTENKSIKKKTKHEFNSTMQNSAQTLGREKVKKHDINYLSLKVKLNDKWECSCCTYHNSNEKDVCEMCSKSKTIGNELQPLVSGGRHCPQCTLVNEKGVTLCNACGKNLKDSPTYI